MTYRMMFVEHQGRAVRVFARDQAALDRACRLMSSLVDGDEERPRRDAIVDALARGVCVAVAHPEEQDPDVFHVFLRDGDRQLFVCAVLPPSALSRDLDRHGFAIEDASTQIMEAGPLDAMALTVAARAWFHRNLADGPGAAAVVVQPWGEGADLASLLDPASGAANTETHVSDEALPLEVAPDASWFGVAA